MTGAATGSGSACSFLLSTLGCSTHDEFITRASRSLPMSQQVCCNLDALTECLSIGLYLTGADAVTIYWVDGEQASQTYEGGRLLSVLRDCRAGVDIGFERDLAIHVVLGLPAWASDANPSGGA